MRALSVLNQLKVPGKEDRSLSPLKFINGKRMFAAMTNKDWALSETYQYVKNKLTA